MGDVLADQDVGSGRHPHTVNDDVLQGSAGGYPDRRGESKRLRDHLAGNVGAHHIGNRRGGPSGDPVLRTSLVAQRREDVGAGAQPTKGPGQRIGRRLVAAQNQGKCLVTNLVVSECRSVFITESQQQTEKVIALDVALATLGDEILGDRGESLPRQRFRHRSAIVAAFGVGLLAGGASRGSGDRGAPAAQCRQSH